jgi:D-alanyl-D-alanine carboxypeptidase
MQKRQGTLPRLRLGFPHSGFLKALAVAGVLIVGPTISAAVAAPDAAIVVDARTGKVLYASNPDAPRHPASLTKMMTLYLLFDALETGKVGLDTPLNISAHAAEQAPSKLGLQPGQSISVRDAILAIVTKSANDVAVAIAERIGGSEKSFCSLMTQRAHQMGMTSSNFVNASGLPDSDQITTARDLATLSRALREHFPQYYSYFATPSFVWRGRRIANHDRLLGHVAGVNGIKTGYTRASGFNLATSVDRNGRQIVGIVIGGETGRQRDNRMASLVEQYLPLASRTTRITNVVPAGPQQLPAAAAQVKVADATLPMPRMRPTENSLAPAVATGDPVVLADSASSVDLATATTARATPSDDTAAAPANSVASLIGANSPLALEADPPQDETAQADTAPGDAAQGDAAANDESVDADPPARHTGWRIQIAATPSQAAAEDMLDRAISKAAKVLAHASPYTEPVTAGGTTLYRARFAGFSSKEAARSACTYLSGQKISCLAVSN